MLKEGDHPRGVEGARAMNRLSQHLPGIGLLQRYLAEIAFDSVAGRTLKSVCPLSRPATRSAVARALGLRRQRRRPREALPVAAAFALFDRFMLLHDELADDSAESIERWGLGKRSTPATRSTRWLFGRWLVTSAIPHGGWKRPGSSVRRCWKRSRPGPARRRATRP